MQTSNLIFIRHSKLVLPYRDHGEMPFSMLAELGTATLNPPIDASEVEKRLSVLSKTVSFGAIRSISASPSQRCQDTAQILLKKAGIGGTSTEFSTDPRLAEIAFDLNVLNEGGVVEAAFRTTGIAAVNTAVFEGMVLGTCESTGHAYARVAALFSAIPQDDELRVFITHDFLLRIVEIFIKRKGALYAPISVEELKSTQRNGYLCGFATTRTFGNLAPISTSL